MEKKLKQATPLQMKVFKIVMCVFGAVMLFGLIMATNARYSQDVYEPSKD